MTQILHITPHLGGGIGKVLYELVEQSIKSHSEFEHMIVCLDKPEKRQFVDKINEHGNKVIECPTVDQLKFLMEKSDIIQLEYINNPVIFKYLCRMDIPPIRLLVWSHNNGLYNPIIPLKLTLDSHKFIFTSPCSFKKQYKTETKWIYNNDGSTKWGEFEEGFLGWIFSSGGFEEFPYVERNYKNISVGYFGSTNFSKMHPNYADYVNEVDIPDFKVKIIGDLHNKEILEKQSNRFEFTGFVTDVVEELKSINVLAYILNPEHYGTTENALLESMSMGIIPIVLENPAEDCIIGDFYSGIKIRNKRDFKNVIRFLYENPRVCKWLGTCASESVRNIFSIENTSLALNNSYEQLMKMEKRKIDFKSIFGDTPDQWFLSCQSNKEIFNNDGTIHLSNINKCSDYSKYMLFEETKGSAIHFSKYFPENERLKKWSKNLKLLQ